MAGWEVLSRIEQGLNTFQNAWKSVLKDKDLRGVIGCNLGRKRKFVRGRAVVFHLNRPVVSRAQLESNQARLEETLKTRRVRAVLGIAERMAGTSPSAS